MLASAQSQITAEYKSLNSAINATGLTNASSSTTINQTMDGNGQIQDNNSTNISNPSKKLSNSSATTSTSSHLGNETIATNVNVSQSISSQKSQQFQQQQQQNLGSKRNTIDPPVNTQSSSQVQQQNVSPAIKPKQQPQPPTQQTQQAPRRRSQSSNLGEITQNLEIQPQKNVPSIDPLQYNALVETNEALKTELQRLSVFELKCKALEKEVCTLLNVIIIESTSPHKKNKTFLTRNGLSRSHLIEDLKKKLFFMW